MQPIANFESYERMPVPHSASLYPLQAAVSHRCPICILLHPISSLPVLFHLPFNSVLCRNLPPSVELFPVALLRNGVRPYPTPSIPMYAPGWNLRRGPAPVPSPADPAIPRNFDPIAHRRLESPSLDRCDDDWIGIISENAGKLGWRSKRLNYISVRQETRKYSSWIFPTRGWEPTGRQVNIAKTLPQARVYI